MIPYFKKTSLDVISFILGGILFSVLSIAVTVYFLNSMEFIYTLSKITLAVFLLIFLVVFIYLIKRGEIWRLLVGKNLYSAREDLVKSIKAILPGEQEPCESDISPVDAIKNLSAIYGDFQLRRLILIGVLGSFGVFGTLVTAAFLVRQTTILSEQIQTSKDIAKSESVYKPYWELMHMDSQENKRVLLSTLLTQGETTAYSGLYLKDLSFSANDGNLSVSGFTCRGCLLYDISFYNTSWTGVFFVDGIIERLKYNGGELFEPNFTSTEINNSIADDQGLPLFSEAHVNRLIMRNTEWIGGGVYGLYDQGTTKFDVKHMTEVHLYDLLIQDVLITAKEAKSDAFYGVKFVDVTVERSTMTDLNLSTSDIYGTLTLNDVKFDSVSFSESHRKCIVGEGLNLEDISWIPASGECKVRSGERID